MWSAMGDEWSSVGNLVAIWRAGDSGGSVVRKFSEPSPMINESGLPPPFKSVVACRSLRNLPLSKYHPIARRMTSGSNWPDLNRPETEGTSDISSR
jgi:hypothetical protein